jgi:hypothetical protein
MHIGERKGVGYQAMRRSNSKTGMGGLSAHAMASLRPLDFACHWHILRPFGDAHLLLPLVRP